MIHIRQYRPAFFEGFENEEHDIASIEEFASLPFIKRLLDEGTVTGWVTQVYTPEHVMISGIYNHLRDRGLPETFVVAFATGDDRLELLNLDRLL